MVLDLLPARPTRSRDMTRGGAVTMARSDRRVWSKSRSHCDNARRGGGISDASADLKAHYRSGLRHERI